jgi:predicted Zn-dependent protease
MDVRAFLLNSFETCACALPRRPSKLHALGRIALAGCLLLAGGGVSQAQLAPPIGRAGNALPSLGDGLELAAATERRLGDRIAMSIYRDPDYLDDPVLGDYVQGIWAPLMAAARARGELGPELEDRFAWDLLLVRDRSVNAFALPGGYLGVHTGLIAVVSNADELAAVLAHELSHVTQRHISRLMTKQQQQTPWVIGAMILGVLAASKSPDAANAAFVGGQALAAQGQLNFSRDMEREADRVGFGVMTDAGFESRGVGGMFEKLQQAARLNDNGSFPYLRSHPLTTERIAEARARTPTVEPASSASAAASKLVASHVHAMMAARARVLGSPGVDELRSMLAEGQRAASAPPGTAASALIGRLYGGALAASRLREHAAALALASRLKDLIQDMPLVARPAQLLAIELDGAAGRVVQAAAASKLSAGGTRAELLLQGRALLAAGRAVEVSDALQTWVVTHPKDAQAWHLLSEAWSGQGELTRAIRADAESRFAQLDYPAALDRLKAAQEMLRSGSRAAQGRNADIEASIIDTRTRQVAALIREQAREDKLDR